MDLTYKGGLTARKFELDLIRRWNNTYNMLISIVGYEEAIMSWVDVHYKDPTINLFILDFDIANILRKF